MHHLFEALGQFAADGNRSVRQPFRQRRQSAGQPLRGLERHDRMRPPRELGPERPPFPRSSRQIAKKLEPICAKTAHGDRGLDRGGPGKHRHRDTGRARSRHQAGSRIADRGHAGIADERDALARLKPRQHLGGPLGLVVLVVAQQTRFDAVPLEEPPRMPGVLAEDELGLAELAEHAQRDVLEIPDRRGADREGH